MSKSYMEVDNRWVGTVAFFDVMRSGAWITLLKLHRRIYRESQGSVVDDLLHPFWGEGLLVARASVNDLSAESAIRHDAETISSHIRSLVSYALIERRPSVAADDEATLFVLGHWSMIDGEPVDSLLVNEYAAQHGRSHQDDDDELYDEDEWGQEPSAVDVDAH